jgi:hypothetical protein
MKKLFQYSLIGIFLFLATAVGFFVFSVSKLPDPSVVKNELENFNSETQPTSKKQAGTTGNQKVSQAEPEAATPEAKVDEPQSTSTTKEISTITKEDYADIRVCENLGKSTVKKLDASIVLKALDGARRDDSILESFRIPLKYIFQSKPVKELFAEIDESGVDNLQGQERKDFLKKINFYSFAAKKAYEIYNNKSEYEEIGDRAYDLYVISQIAQKKPELGLDKNVTDFCNQLQTSLATKTKTNIEEERKELLKLITYSGLTPKELNFDPAVRMKFQMELDKTSIKFGLAYPGMAL